MITLVLQVGNLLQGRDPLVVAQNSVSITQLAIKPKDILKEHIKGLGFL